MRCKVNQILLIYFASELKLKPRTFYLVFNKTENKIKININTKQKC